MTMRVALENEDPSRTLRVTTRAIDGEKRTPLQSNLIGPLKTGEVWLHRGQDAVLSEEPEPTPAA